MAVLSGFSGDVSAWTNNAGLISTGADPSSFTLNINADEIDSTPLTGSTNNAVWMPGLKNWQANIVSILNPSRIGNKGGVTFSTGYVGDPIAVSVRSWSITFVSTELETTDFEPTGDWRTFRGGLNSWSGTYECLMDDTTQLDAGADWLASSPAAATFTYDSTDSPNPKALSGNIIVTGYTINVTPSDLQTVTVSFRGSGALTSAGSTNPPIAAGAIAVPTAGAITLNSSSLRTFTGTAFPQSIAFNVPYDSLIEITTVARGTGALAVN